MSEMNGLDFFRLAKEIDSNVFFFLIIDKEDEDLIVETLDLGFIYHIKESKNYQDLFPKLITMIKEVQTEKRKKEDLRNYHLENKKLKEEIQVLRNKLRNEKENIKELLNQYNEQSKITQNYLDNFNNLITNSPACISFFELDKKNKLIFRSSNKSLNRIFKIEFEQFIGKTFSELFPAFLETELQDKMTNIAKDGGYWTTQEIEYIDDTVSLNLEIRAYQTKPGTVVLVISDITELKMKEIEEKQLMYDLDFLSKTAMELVSINEYRNIFQYYGEKVKELIDESIVYVASFDANTQLFTSESVIGFGKGITNLAKLLGRDPIGMNVDVDPKYLLDIEGGKLVLVNPDLESLTRGNLSNRIGNYIRKMFNIGETYAIGFVSQKDILGIALISLKDGRSIENVKLIEALANQVSSALQRTVVERELNRSEFLYSALVENMNDGLAIDDENGNLIYVNNKFCEMIGYDRSELLHKPVINFLEEDNVAIYKNQTKERKKGKAVSYEMTWINRKGIKIYARVKPRPLYDDSNQYIGSFAVISDISKIKESEETLRKNQERLRIQRDELESFASTIAHDFRGRLQILTGLIEMQETEYTNTILDQIDSFTDFINDLLILAKKGDLLGEIKEIELNDYVKNISSKIELVNKNITFKIQKLPTITADPIKLEQVFDNIFMNIVKHANAKEIKITSENKRDYYTIEIQDNGIGINKERLNEIRKSWVTRKYRSFGLLIAVKIMEAHNGKITIDSEINIGTKITLYFPKKDKN
jgi:PAS domain S-box-containing protein